MSAAATRVHAHAILCGLSPGSCGCAPPPPPPARPSVSPLARQGSARWAAPAVVHQARPQRVGEVRLLRGFVVWTARANCSAPRTSPKSGSEGLVVRRERAVSRAGLPVFSITRTVLPGQARFRGASVQVAGPWAASMTRGICIGPPSRCGPTALRNLRRAW
jgi:hypothetical protein